MGVKRVYILDLGFYYTTDEVIFCEDVVTNDLVLILMFDSDKLKVILLKGPSVGMSFFFILLIIL